jgi:hypothetical protein
MCEADASAEDDELPSVFHEVVRTFANWGVLTCLHNMAIWGSQEIRGILK